MEQAWSHWLVFFLNLCNCVTCDFKLKIKIRVVEKPNSSKINPKYSENYPIPDIFWNLIFLDTIFEFPIFLDWNGITYVLLKFVWIRFGKGVSNLIHPNFIPIANPWKLSLWASQTKNFKDFSVPELRKSWNCSLGFLVSLVFCVILIELLVSP